MGCSPSKIEQEEAVVRCKERRMLMKEAVGHRNAFAAHHSAYVMALKHTGAALNDYGAGEVAELRLPSSAGGSLPFQAAPVDQLPPPPPPLPDQIVPPPPPLQKALSMPDLRQKLPAARNTDGPIQEEDESAESAGAEASGSRLPADQSHQWQESAGSEFGTYIFSPASIPGMLEENRQVETAPGVAQKPESGPARVEELPEEAPAAVAPLPPKPPKKPKQSTDAVQAPEPKRPRFGETNLIQILQELDDQFLNASHSGHPVKKMLETHRLHFHSNFADNRGHIDHSERVMRVITWNRSFRGRQDPDDGKDLVDDAETHATVLDKLLAWEKKLYDEIKAGEIMKIKYQREVASLNKQKKRGVGHETLERTKAVVSHLHTRYIVDMQSMDSTVSEIYRLRDEQLYPKLVELINGMAEMWETMQTCHSNQMTVATDLRLLDVSNSCKETSIAHHERTEQLYRVTTEWSVEFQKLMQHQKSYIRTMNNWVRHSLVPVESNLKEKVSSPPRISDPPIQTLLKAWNDELDRLPDAVAKNAISSFAAVVEGILLQQRQELNQKQRCEDARKDHERKKQSYQDWLEKHKKKRGLDVADPERADGGDDNDSTLEEKKRQIESSKRKWNEELQLYEKLCKQTREKSLGSLKSGLPAILHAMVDYARSCAITYDKVRTITRSQKV